MAKNENKAVDEVLELHNRPLTERQVLHLSALTGKATEALLGLSIAEIQQKFRFEFDLSILLFRRVCGKVVKTDPATGEEYPVPFATVHVEGSDCNLLAYSPPEGQWLWFYPLSCQREQVASTVTDQCGNFCVLIPRWEIDWILRWRKTKICFPDIFIKPSILDILKSSIMAPALKPSASWSEKDPDSLSFIINQNPDILEHLLQVVDPLFADKVSRIQQTAELGAPAETLRNLLDRPAFERSLPPPLPDDIEINETANSPDFDNISAKVAKNIDAPLLESIQLNKFIGPFRRCKNIYMPEWHLIADVPDITFRVTQDIDGDGDEEVIYDEGFFDVRWNNGDIPNVVLQASEIAIAANVCLNPEVACQASAIVSAGLMPLYNSEPVPYHDQLSGYARRPNRPHPNGTFSAPALPMPPPDHLLATAPFAGTLQLYGCNHHEGAEYYRLRYQFNGSALSTFSGQSWNVFRWLGSPGHLDVQTVIPDVQGWYAILPETDRWLPSHLLLNWPTKGYQNGLYQISLELADSSKHILHTTTPIGVQIDNALPVAAFTTLAWRVQGGGEWHGLSFTCPVIRRPAGSTIEISVGAYVSAPHLRSVHLRGNGCGAGAPVLISAAPDNWEVYAGGSAIRHWHRGASDNSFDNTATPAVFEVSGSSPSGVYSFYLAAYSRAFNPSGGGGGFEADWHYNPTENWRHANISIAVVDDIRGG